MIAARFLHSSPHRPPSMHLTRSLLLTSLLGAGSLTAGEWSHIKGPQLNRKTDETVPAKWPANGPKRVWEVAVDGGFSSFVTGDGRVYTVVQKGGKEVAVGLDRKTGKTLWELPMSAADYTNGGNRGVSGNDGGDGPRSTPVFAAGRVFVIDGRFVLHAVDAASGRELWKHDLVKDFGGRTIHWSNSASPLVMGNRVIAMGGGKGASIVAFKADTGAVEWKSGNDRATYATPVLATIHGKEQALFMMERGLVAIDPTDGKELWHYPFPQQTATATSPVVWNDIVNVTAGYGVGGGACKVVRNGDKWEATEIWRSRGNRDTASHWMTSVVHDGYLYGCYGHGSYGNGAFKCIDIRTGKVMWEKPGFGHGQTIMVGGKLLVTTDAGRLVLIEPSTEKYIELSSTKAIDGKVWASLALSDGQIFMRSTKHAACLQF